MAEQPPFDASVLADGLRDAIIVAEEWSSTMTIAPDRGWTDDFTGWLKDTPAPEHARTVRAMKQLHAQHPRAYEVCYRALVLGERMEGIARWLNERAHRNNIVVDYSVKDATALFLAGITFVRSRS